MPMVGARNSSNSNRLREVGKQHGVPAYLIQDETELDQSWFVNIKKVGITSGASTPEVLVQRVLDRLRSFGVNVTRELDGIRETTTFRLPKSLMLKKAEQTKAGPTAKVNF